MEKRKQINDSSIGKQRSQKEKSRMPLVLPCLLSLVNQIIPSSLKQKEDSSSCESDASSVSSKKSLEEAQQMDQNNEKRMQQDLSSVSLPDGFAERVLELEMNIQADSTDIVSIQSLIDLYSVSYLKLYSYSWRQSTTTIQGHLMHLESTVFTLRECRIYCFGQTLSLQCSKFL